MLTLYKAKRSGNCYKVELFLWMNRIDYCTELVDVLQRANQTPAFEAISAFQQVPALEDSGEYLWDSHAILLHLAGRHAAHWMPAPGTIELARMHQWLSVSANEIGNSLQPMRLVHLIGLHEAAHHMNVEVSRFDVEGCERRCHRVLNRMDQQLSRAPWLAGATPSLADIACYPYTALVHQGHIDVAAYPQVQAWLQRFEALPLWRPMDAEAAVAS